jgi:PEP-CTERM motif
LTFGNPGASVDIQWSSDNGAEFYLNGNLLSTVGSTGYGALVSFTIAAATFSGSNTFLVKVQNEACNCNNPTGLLVSASPSSAPAPSAVPLPAALPLFASGLGVMGFLGWRRKRKKAAAMAAA